tara:strand:+ start:7064 stop:8017 length:954 start_codon:yes stop_codon:yes gene_type:complete
MALYLTESEISQIINIQLAIDSVEESFKLIATGEGVTKPRERLPIGTSSMNYMSAGINTENITGLKVYVPNSKGTKFYVHIMNSLNGELISIIEANMLGQYRTGAASGVASKFLANPNSRKVLLIGTGFQSFTQILSLDNIFDLEEVYVYSRSEENRNNFIKNYQPKINAKLIAIENVSNKIDNIDIINVITNSKTPVLDGNNINTGVHINAAGSNHALRRELDTKTILKANKIFVDDLDQAKNECGDLIYPESLGLIQWRNIVNFSDFFRFPNKYIRKKEDITIFESQGLALWDLVLANKLYQLAKKKDLGKEINV